jgi:general transcription factor 3C polypeptide 5 (transcription factor C subunit 1)
MQMATDIRAAIRGAASWRAVVRRPGSVDGKDGNEVGEGGKKVQWEDEGEGDEGSEGEEVGNEVGCDFRGGRGVNCCWLAGFVK